VSAYVDGVRARWRDGLQVSLAVVVDGALVGGCDLDHLDAERPDLGYWIAAVARGHGYATRAARLLLDWASTSLDLGVVDVEVEHDNAASIAVAARLGFTRVAGAERTDGARRLAVWRWTRP
jgi:RimJ/RimL family protein N-acetyltransferase